MLPRPIRDVWVKAQSPWVAARCVLFRSFLEGSGSRSKDTPCCMGGVSGGGVDHQFNFALQFDQPCQNVVQ